MMKKEKLKNKQPEKVPHKQNQPRQGQVDKNRYAGLPALVGIILLGIIIYANSFDCSFHFDDSFNIVDNTKIRDLFDVKAWWNYNPGRPIAFFTFALNYQLSGLDVWPWHFVNLLIHLANACLVWWLTMLIFSTPALRDHPMSAHKRTLALLTGLLFVSHPLATQSVTYIVQRMASLAAMFYLLSVVFYAKARLADGNGRSKNWLFAGALASALLAILTKENAFTIPFAIVLFEICFFQTKKISINLKDYRVILSFVAFLGIVCLALSKYSFDIFKPIPPDTVNNFRTITSLDYLFTQFSVIVKYIGLLLWPLNQNVDYDYRLSTGFFELRTVLSFALLLSLFISGIFLYKRYRVISFGIFWFFLTLSIESGFIPISDLIFEHRTYLPSVGFFLVLSSGIYLLLWDRYKTIAISIFVLIIAFNSILTVQRNRVWKNDLTLWSDVISKSPDKPRGYVNRGVFYKTNGKYQTALKDFNKSIELQPKHTLAYMNRGIVYTLDKNYDQAIKEFNKAIELEPTYAESYYDRGHAYLGKGKREEAFNDFKKAIELQPTYTMAFNNIGNIYFDAGKYEDALFYFNKTIELQPTYAEAYNNRGSVYASLKNWDKAIADFTKALELQPDYQNAKANLELANQKQKEQ